MTNIKQSMFLFFGAWVSMFKQSMMEATLLQASYLTVIETYFTECLYFDVAPPDLENFPVMEQILDEQEVSSLLLEDDPAAEDDDPTSPVLVPPAPLLVGGKSTDGESNSDTTPTAEEDLVALPVDKVS